MTRILKLPFVLFRPVYERTSLHTSVIEDVNDQRLKEAYAHCREITRYYAKTFYLATRFLPNHKQRAIFAIYGLCRYLDNLVDDAEDLIREKKISALEIEERLEEFKEQLCTVYAGGYVDDPILIAFSDTINQYDIPIALPFLLIDGVKTDLTKNRFYNFEEVYDYSYKVASVVGLMTSEVFGYKMDKALDHAVDLGIAMQLTNILRDVGEDLDRDRIYIPEVDLKMFEVSESDLFRREMTENFRELIRYQIQKARTYYKSAELGIPMLSKDSRLPVYLARYNYARILDKIEENKFDVLSQRAYLSQSEKLSILPRVFWDLRAAS
ncbi:MAG: squalene/phytoene synthase family protein [Bacteroidota bacterium]